MTRDSLFTLEPGALAGLIVLSLLVGVGMVVVAVALGRGRWPWRLVVGVALAVVFLWLSPQVYYTYYRAVIPGLPMQWVIGPLPDWGHVWRVATLSDGSQIADRSRTVLFWAIIGAALAAPWVRARLRRRRSRH